MDGQTDGKLFSFTYIDYLTKVTFIKLLTLLNPDIVHKTVQKFYSRDFRPFSIIAYFKYITLQVAGKIIKDNSTENRFQISHSIVTLWLKMSCLLKFLYRVLHRKNGTIAEQCNSELIRSI